MTVKKPKSGEGKKDETVTAEVVDNGKSDAKLAVNFRTVRPALVKPLFNGCGLVVI